MKKAWVITVDMGYGHQRAAYPLKDIANERVITANSDKIISEYEKNKWHEMQTFYEWVSRTRYFPLFGKIIFGAYDELQRISPYYPYRDLSRPTLGLKIMKYYIKKGLCKGVVNYTKKENIPFISTFMVPALAADHHGLKEIYAVVTDTDINRVWVSENPKNSTINYLAPTQHVVKRLREYGVPGERIFFTGFPLPKENLGGENLQILEKDLGNRLPNLDPNRVFLNKERDYLKHRLGKKLKRRSDHRLTLTFVLGGAGAQRSIGKQVLKSLKEKLLNNEMVVNIVVGTKLHVADYFREAAKELGLEQKLDKTVFIVGAFTKVEYFQKFSKVLHNTDILWTKPSEMAFYTALGLPIIISPPLGSHEEYNSEWLIEMGAGFKQQDPKYTDEWLFDLLKEGRLAEAAFRGFVDAPKFGTYNIEKLVFAKDKNKVKLMH